MSKTPDIIALALPVWYVFSSFRWAGYSTAIARLLARNLTSVIRALVVSVPSLAVLFERPYYTVLYKITLTIVSSIFPRTYFQNYLRQKQKKGILTILTNSLHFRLKIDGCFHIATTLCTNLGVFQFLSNLQYVSYIFKISAYLHIFLSFFFWQFSAFRSHYLAFTPTSNDFSQLQVQLVS